MTILKRAADCYNKIERGVLILGMAYLVVTIFGQVFCRFVLHFSPSWTEEMGRYVFIWITWIGVSAGVKEDNHIKVEILQDLFHKKGLHKAEGVQKILIAIIWVGICAFMVVYGWQIVSNQLALQVKTVSAGLPIWPFYLCLPISGVLVGLRLAVGLVQDIRELAGKSGEKKEAAK